MDTDRAKEAANYTVGHARAAKQAMREEKLPEALTQARWAVAWANGLEKHLTPDVTPTPPPEPPPPPPEPPSSTRAEFFAADSPWNTPIAANAVGKSVASLVSHGGGRADPLYAPFSADDWAHPVFYAKASDPLKEVRVDHPSWGGFNSNGKKIHLPVTAVPASFKNPDADRHLVVVQPEDGKGDFPGMAVGFYDCRQTSGPILAQAAGYSHAKDGTGTDVGNITAAGFNGAAGLILSKDIERGEIPHALFGVLNCSCAPARYPAQPGTTAVKCGSSRYPGVNCANVSNWPGMGSRLQLDPAYDLSKFPKGQAMVLRAIQKYGILIGDTGFYSRARIFALMFEGINSAGQVLRDFCERAKSEGWGSGGPNYSLDYGKNVDWTKLRLLA